MRLLFNRNKLKIMETGNKDNTQLDGTQAMPLTSKLTSQPGEGTGIGGSDISGEDSAEESNDTTNHSATDETNSQPVYGKLANDEDRRNNELI
jgi:hypothetical protein